jgi:hypothetical protein
MLKMNEKGVTTAASRLEILEYVVTGHALYVEQAKGKRLNCVGLADVQLPPEDGDRWVEPETLLEKPLLLDAQTANAMLTVRKALTSEKALHNFDTFPWHQIAAMCWKHVK